MTTWNREIAFYIDVDAPEGAVCLLDGKSSTNKSATAYFLQNDKLTLKLYFRRKADSSLNASTAMELLAGEQIVFAGKATDNLDAVTLLFSATSFTEEGSGDDLRYSATLDLNTAEILALFAALTATSQNIKVDIEVQNSDNTERTTFQFDAVLKQHVYNGESNPQPGTPIYPLPQDLVCKQVDGGWVRFIENYGPCWYESTTNKWYPQVVKIVDGIAVFAPGEGITV